MSLFRRLFLSDISIISRSVQHKLTWYPVRTRQFSPFCTARNMSATNDTFSSNRGYRNRLGLERSPYLLQHANNPVNWYPWGEEAFQKARAENKLIFLSVGYSTCHWCHVMERESFENEEIGQLLNENFVSIKVDREERPDVDHIYMTFVQATSGGGGWPMSVWLTPDLKPIVGGTYFPPDDRYFGQPGFKSILNKISTAWRESSADVLLQSSALLEALSRATRKSEGTPSSALPDVTLSVQKCFTALSSAYDPKMGGFSASPKFPQPVNLNFMLHVYESCRREASVSSSTLSDRGQRALDMTLHTLRMMARGGIHDHVGKGFHRYSTDEEWHVPHFEKMLYDQAQLAVIYLDAFQITKEELFSDMARDILCYVSRDLSDQSGGFYSAEDADSLPAADAAEKREGAFCVWTFEEVQEVVQVPVEGTGSKVKPADVFCFHYDVRQEGNVHVYKDPHGELTKKNVLIERGDIDRTAKHFGITVQQTRDILACGREQLWKRRQQRPRPHLDNKMLTSWNGMMISAFARASQVLDDPSYLRRAVDAIKFVHGYMYEADSDEQSHSSVTGGRLLRSCYVDSQTNAVIKSSSIYGFADDYASMIRAALDVYEASHDESWLQWATLLQKKQDELFWDNEKFGYYMTTSEDASIIIRLKEDQDGAEPSYNSISAHNLLRLSSIMDSSEYRQRAEQLFTSLAGRLETLPIAVPELLTALMLYNAPSMQICVCGPVSSDETTSMLRCINRHYLPRKTVLVLDSDSQQQQQQQQQHETHDFDFLRRSRRSLEIFTQIDGKTTAYVCDNNTCSLPVTSVSELDKLLS